MGKDDYAAIGGGALKLKGSKISKKRKKSKPTLTKDEPAAEHAEQDEHEHQSAVAKTDSERRHEEARKKRLLQMTQASGSRPGLLKTHKERVEDLNTYLSRLSEHHDMPKIGPG